MSFDTFGSRLRQLRKERQMTQKELADKLGLAKSSISMYENGKHEPNFEMLNKIAVCFGVSVGSLVSSSPEYAEAMTFIADCGQDRLFSAFQKLDGYGKITVVECAEILSQCDQYYGHSKEEESELMIDMLYHGNKLVSVVNAWTCMSKAEQDKLIGFIKALASSKDEDVFSDIPPEDKIIPLFGTAAAAGPGEFDTGLPWEEYSVPVSSNATFAIRISGDSMEPVLHDGQIALCAEKTPGIGDVAVMMVNGCLVVKQFIADNYGNIYLRSLNRDRKDADLDIKASGDDTVTCYGIVLLPKRPPLVDN